MEIIHSEIEELEFFLEKPLTYLNSIFKIENEAICYIKHPLFNINIEPPSFLIISRNFGIHLVSVYDFSLNNIKDVNDEIWKFQNWKFNELELGYDEEIKIASIRSKLDTNREIMKFKKENSLNLNSIIYLPLISKNEFIKKFPEVSIENIYFEEDFENKIKLIVDGEKKYLNDTIWTNILNIFSGADKLNKLARKKESIEIKAGVLSEIDNFLQSFDMNQVRLMYEIPNGPQRIRGLAGTGKTIILTMRAAYLHYKNPELDIVYTFHTHSLYDYIRELIEKFYKHFSGGEPNFKKLKIMHAWGGISKQGLYSYVSNILKHSPRNLTSAKALKHYYPELGLLGASVKELMDKHKNILPELFDVILIDEGQDFDNIYLNFCYMILKEPKRLYWVYDELQSLENISIPTSEDIFGKDETGKLVVDLDGVYDNNIEKDFVLHKTYRNPGIILMIAHFYGLGVFRKSGPIQFIPNETAWEDIGYKILEGKFEKDEKIVAIRPKENSPNPIEKIQNSKNLISIKAFNNKDDELDYIVNSIKNDIEVEKIRPEDILVIGFTTSSLYKSFDSLIAKLLDIGINSYVPDSRDSFKKPNFITLTTIFKAKGNEAFITYIFNFEESEDPYRIVQSRNAGFTAITRSKGWCNILGTGPKMILIEKEINTIKDTYPRIEFKMPDMNLIKRRLDTIESRKRFKRIKEREKKLNFVLDSVEIDEGDFYSEKTKQKILELAKKIKNEE